MARKKGQCTKKSHKGCVKNPYTGRWIKRDGQTAKDVFKYHLSSLKEEGILYKHGVGRYKRVPRHLFCGPAGKAPMGTYPVNNPSRCSAALSYARDAPYPNGIRKCAMRIAKKHGWRCGTASKSLKSIGVKPSHGRRGGSKKTAKKTTKKTVRKTKRKAKK